MFDVNLYFQFFTQNQSAAAIDLIQLPTLLTSGQISGGKTKMSSGGKLSSAKFSSIETLSSKMADVRFNELEVIYDINELKIGATIARVKMLNGVFAPSATCDLWFSSKDFPKGDRDSLMREMNAETQEGCLAGLGINRKPSVFEWALEMETSDSENQVLDNCAEWLASVLTERFVNLKPFGCCDAGGREMFVRLESSVLMIDKIRVMAKILPTAYPELGEKFDDLHPIMFGAKQVCSELAAALGKDAKLIIGTNASNFAAIRLNPKCDIAAAKELAKDWLLPTIR